MERVLTCSCGNRISVTSAQAGRQVACSGCGKQLPVPTLRGLAELPLVEGGFQHQSSKKTPSSAWRWRGPAMAACLAVMMGCLGFAFYNLRIWSQIDTTRDLDGHLQVVAKVLESAGPDQLSQMWDEYSGISLRRPNPPEYKLYRDFAQQKLRNGQINAGVAAAMLVCVLLLWKSASWGRSNAIAE